MATMQQHTMNAVSAKALVLVVTMMTVTVTVLPPGGVEAGPLHTWRYVFPFFPAELDILIGHLRTSVKRLEEVLEQCEDMAEGEWKGGNKKIGVQALTASPGNRGNDMEDKVERILEMREKVGELEDEIEECRFHFWTGQEAD